MKRYLCGLLTLACMVSLAACGRKTENGGTPENAEIPEDQFAVNIVCNDKDIDQISYTAYVDGEYRGTGGQVILDSDTEETGNVFHLRFSPDDFEEGDDMTQFSISLSPVRAGDRENGSTTEPVAVPAEYGSSYTVSLLETSGGYDAELL